MMDPIERENELKLDILESLARSQRAMAVIIEHMAEVSGGSRNHAEGLLQHLRTLVRVQEALACRITGIRVRRIRKGRPGAWWLSGKPIRGTNRRAADGGPARP